MPDTTEQVSIVFRGETSSVEDALKKMQAVLGSLGTSATETAGELHKTAAAENEVEREAKGMLRGMEVAADGMALFSKESSEAARHLYEVRSLATDMRGAFSSLGTAIAGGTAAFAGVAAIGFMHSAVEEGLAGEKAQAQLNAALKNNKDEIERVNKATEDGASQWARYGVTVGQLKGIMAEGLGRGVGTDQILANSKGVSDLAVALHTDMAGAIDEVTSGPRGLKALGHALNLNKQDLVTFTLGMNLANTSSKRFAFAMQQIEKSRFAGQGDALANTDTGKMLQFQTSMKDLEETMGQGLIPLMGNFANILNGMVQTANSLLAGFGGLSGVLSSKWVPIVALSLVGLKGFLSVVNLIEGLFRTKFVSTLMGTRQEIDQGARATADYVQALDDIPPSVTTTAVFDTVAGTAAKDGYWIPNILSVPAFATTTAIFETGAANREVATYEGELAAVPKTVTTTAGVGVGTLPAIAITAAATVTTYAVASGALKPVTDAIGNLTATVGQWIVTTTQPIRDAIGNLTATVGTWVVNAAITPVGDALGNLQAVVGRWVVSAPLKPVADALGTLTGQVTRLTLVRGALSSVTAALSNLSASVTRITVVRGALTALGNGLKNLNGAITKWVSLPTPPVVKTTGRVTHWSEAGAPEVKVKGYVTKLDIAKGTPIPTIKTGETVHISGAVHVNATADVTSATVPKGTRLIVPAGVSVNGLSVPKGTALSVDARGRITGVDFPTDKKGHRQTYSVPVNAKVQIDAGTLTPFFGTPQHPTHTLYYKMQPAPGQHVDKNGNLHIIVDQPNQGGGGFGDFALQMGEGLTLGIVQSLVLARLLKGGGTSGLGDAIRKIIGKGPKPPKGGAGAGGGNYDPELDAQLKAVDDYLLPPEHRTPVPPAFTKPAKPKPVTNPGPSPAPAPAPGPTVTPGTVDTPANRHAISTGFTDMFKDINWSAVGKAAGFAASIAAGFAAIMGAAFGTIGKVLGGAGAGTAVILNPIRGQVAQMVAKLAIDMVTAMGAGIKSASSALASIGKTIITTLMTGIRNALPGPVQAAFDNLTHNAYRPHGHNGPPDTKKGGPGGGWSGGTISQGVGAWNLGGGTSLAAQLSAMTGLHVPSSGAAAHQAARFGGPTINATFHITGATDPEAVGRVVNKKLEEFVRAL